MNTVDSLPRVNKSQLEEMHALAEQKMQEQFGVQPEVQHFQEPQEQYVAEEESSHEEVEEEYEDESIEEEVNTPPVTQKKFSQATELNIREMRLLKEQSDRELAEAKREKAELMRTLLAYQQNGQPSPKPSVQEQEDEFGDVDDNELIEGSHYKIIKKEVRALKQTIKDLKENTKKITYQTNESNLRASFPDFDKVMSIENLNKLQEMNPDLAETILKNENPHTQRKLAYEMIKQFGIYKDKSSFDANQKLAQANAAKPRTISSLSKTGSGDTALSHANAFANGMTPEQSRQLYLEARRAANGR